MKKAGIKKLVISMFVIAAGLATAGAVTMFADPGDSSDPIITLSYIENILKGEMSFKVVNMEKGQKLVCEQGTELILRMGKATVNATEKGGLADVTAGYDLADGEEMPANHHLIVPVADGRGITANNTVIVMVKGDYTLE
ncbi:MAG: hypothetical protein UH081_06205 [Clostridia bacterium]|nr:hypothetical protein [Clostridia bacterium]